MPLTIGARQDFLNAIIRGDANPYTYLAVGDQRLNLALFVGGSGNGVDPGDDTADGAASVADEVSDTGTAYARTPVEFGTAAQQPTSGNPASISNDATVTFPTCQGTAWATGTSYVSGWALYDNATSPSCIWTGAFDTGKNVDVNDTVTIASTNLVLRLT